MISTRKGDLESSKRDHRNRSPYSPSYKSRKHGSTSPPRHRHVSQRDRDALSPSIASDRWSNYGKNYSNHQPRKHAGKSEGGRDAYRGQGSSLKHSQKAYQSRHSGCSEKSDNRGSPSPKRSKPFSSSGSHGSGGRRQHYNEQRITSNHSSSREPKPCNNQRDSVAKDPVHSPMKSLQPFLEDIDSDEEAMDSMPGSSHSSEEKDHQESPLEESKCLTKLDGDGLCSLTKEEVFQVMEDLESCITKAEEEKKILEAKMAVVSETDVTYHVPSCKMFISEEVERHEVDGPPTDIPLHVKIYMSNKDKRSAVQQGGDTKPLYHQPCEVPGFLIQDEMHRTLYPRLVQYITQKRKEQHKKDVKLCEEYDNLFDQWERHLEQHEQNPRKRAKDQKTKELFEKFFPEIKRIKEPSEKLNRIDSRGINIVRSDAEFNELMDALNAQEEIKDRHRKCHAAVPSMVTDHQCVSFRNRNGLLVNPLDTHKQSISEGINSWTENEKVTFKNIYALYPKNFERIACFLPHKTIQQCIHYYYLTKKKMKYKDFVNAVKEEKKHRGLIKVAHESPTSGQPSLTPDNDNLSSDQQTVPLLTRRPTLLKPKGKRMSPYGDWSENDISGLREGIALHGRLWTKVSRQVSGKTPAQCKTFFQEYQTDSRLKLGSTLEEHLKNKSPARIQRKSESKSVELVSNVLRSRSSSRLKQTISVDTEGEEASQSDSATETDTSSTKTAVSSDETDEEPSVQVGKVVQRRKFHQIQRSISKSHRLSEDSLDVLFTAAEIVEGATVPSEVALHDHTYCLTQDMLFHNVDVTAASGLSLIAAAAAVVSPTMPSHSSSNRVSPLLSPVKAPRGRPPNSSKRSNSTSQRLQPSFLSPAGPSLQVPLTDQKTGPRARSRSASTTKAASPITYVRTPPAKYLTSPLKPKPAISPTLGTAGLKVNSSSSPATSSTPGADFETLVNVAAAAPHLKGSSEAEVTKNVPTTPTGLSAQKSPPMLMEGGKPPQGKPAVPGSGFTSPDGHHSIQYGFFLSQSSYPGSTSSSSQQWVPHQPPPWGFPVFPGPGVIYSSSGKLVYPSPQGYATPPFPMVPTFHGPFPSHMMPNSHQQSQQQAPQKPILSPPVLSPNSATKPTMPSLTTMPRHQGDSAATSPNITPPKPAKDSAEITKPVLTTPGATRSTSTSSTGTLPLDNSADKPVDGCSSSGISEGKEENDIKSDSNCNGVEEMDTSLPVNHTESDREKHLGKLGEEVAPPVFNDESSPEENEQEDTSEAGSILTNFKTSLKQEQEPEMNEQLPDGSVLDNLLPEMNFDPSNYNLPASSDAFDHETFSPDAIAISLMSSVNENNSDNSESTLQLTNIQYKSEKNESNDESSRFKQK